MPKGSLGWRSAEELTPTVRDCLSTAKDSADTLLELVDQILDAHALKTDRERCLGAGRDAYLSKPLDTEAMIALVESLAEARGENAQPTADSRQPAGEAPLLSAMTISRSGAADQAEGYDLQEAIQKCFGSYEMFQQMVTCLFDEAEGGLDQMRGAVADGAGPRLAQLAHRLRGTLVYLAAGPCTRLSARLEQIGASGDLSEATAAVEQLDLDLTALRQRLADHRLPSQAEG